MHYPKFICSLCYQTILLVIQYWMMIKIISITLAITIAAHAIFSHYQLLIKQRHLELDYKKQLVAKFQRKHTQLATQQAINRWLADNHLLINTHARQPTAEFFMLLLAETLAKFSGKLIAIKPLRATLHLHINQMSFRVRATITQKSMVPLLYALAKLPYWNYCDQLVLQSRADQQTAELDTTIIFRYPYIQLAST